MKKSSRWIEHDHLFSQTEYECSNCGYRCDKPYVTCPNCGADMNGSKYDPQWVDEVEMMDMFFDD
ncbi:MAG: hypothetical protein ILP10_05090 [Lachnospiraceae bacterium]|nr:hypothetical protein [Lachnospiraceae bacterium]